MEDPKESLVIEFLGVKATALGAYPVSALTLLLAVVVLAALVAGPTQVAGWFKRLRKPSED